VALLLCITMVIKAPTATARKRFEVNFSSTERILLPAAIFIPSLIISIPYKNIPIPPKRLVTIKNQDISFPDDPAAEDARRKDGTAISKQIVIGNEFLIFNFLYMLFPFVSFLLGNECIEKIFIYKGTLIKIKNFAIG
jgi:hypothetical protein